MTAPAVNLFLNFLDGQIDSWQQGLEESLLIHHSTFSADPTDLIFEREQPGGWFESDARGLLQQQRRFILQDCEGIFGSIVDSRLYEGPHTIDNQGPQESFVNAICNGWQLHRITRLQFRHLSHIPIRFFGNAF